MKSWMKWALVAAVLALPAAGLAITKYHSHVAHCPMTPDCPCKK